MPNIKSAIKRVEIAERNRIYNKSYRSAVATSMKKVMALADDYEAKREGVSLDHLQELMNEAFSRIDKAAQRKVIPKNTAARRKSRLSRRIGPLILQERGITNDPRVALSGNLALGRDVHPEKSVHNALQKLEEISKLQPDWNSYGARPATEVSLEKARKLLDKVMKHQATGHRKVQAEPFAVTPIPLGGVQLEWRGRQASIEVDVDPEGRFGYLLIQSQGSERVYEERDNVPLSEILELIHRVQGH